MSNNNNNKKNKLVTVVDSTSEVGDFVTRALLKEGYKVRALTRNIESNAAKALKNLDAEVVKCSDTDSPANIQAALIDTEVIFYPTNFWSSFEKEVEYGIKFVDAALSVKTVKHYVFHGLISCKTVSNDKYSVPHFDLKYRVEQHLRKVSAENPSFISSFIYSPFYMQNFSSIFTPKRSTTQNGTYTISMPLEESKPLDMVDIKDIGPIVAGIVANPSKYSGVVVPLAGERLTGDQICQVFTKVTGKQVKYNYIPPATFRTFAFPYANEIASMFQFFSEFGAFNDLDTSLASSIHKLTSLEDYLISTKFRFE
ncbi:hypothetical protein RB653_005156 [Dictyostelium firmibasis]|uniref:NmrA-like domain-containing protein n=1 Tax=Dictyostelium firmibasis TaxID=79012 RepID=A0AAN7U0S3_9MYCE